MKAKIKKEDLKGKVTCSAVVKLPKLETPD
jgi:hypothetical protein